MVDQNTLRRRGAGLIACDPAAASPGYTLFAPLTGTGSELPDGSLLLFDNGTFRTGESVTYSRVIAVDRRTRAITWQYRDEAAARLFPDPTNAIFRAYRYTPDEVPYVRT